MDKSTGIGGDDTSTCCEQNHEDRHSDEAPFITINQIPVYFSEDWNTGIGGGLWSTGLAMAKYWQQHSRSVRDDLIGLAFQKQKRQNQGLLQCQQNGGINNGGDSELLSAESCLPGLSALELGSGNGFLSICFLAAAMAADEGKIGGHPDIPILIDEIVVTDMADHLGLMTKTLKANSHIVKSLTSAIDEQGGNGGKGACGIKVYTECFKNENIPLSLKSSRTKSKFASVTVIEHRWGEFSQDNDVQNTTHEQNITGDDNSDIHILRKQLQTGGKKFDFIFGSDLAYRDELHAPLISSLKQFSHERTVMLIGVTMSDTKPVFFDLLTDAGFRYERLADHLMEPEFRGKTFGLFVIQRLDVTL